MRVDSLSFCAAALIAACSSSTSPGGTDGGNTGASGTDGGTTGMTMTSPPLLGSVYFETSTVATTTSYVATAGFSSTAQATTVTTGCKRSTTSGTTTGTTPPAPVSAGTITLTDGATSLGKLSFSATKGYTALVTGLKWSAGDLLGASATGATVPAFTGTVTAPVVLQGVTLGGKSLSGTVSTPIGGDLQVTWKAGIGTYVLATLSVAGSSPQVIECWGDDSGSLTIPASLLSGFTVGGSGGFDLQRVVVTYASVSGGSIGIYAESTLAASVKYASGSSGSGADAGTSVVDAGSGSTTTTTGDIGSPCSSNSDCTVGLTPTCNTQYAGGSCTSYCAGNSDCGSNGVCISTNGTASCLEACTGDSSCDYPNYICQAVSYESVCEPSCLLTGCPEGQSCDSTTGLCTGTACIMSGQSCGDTAQCCPNLTCLTDRTCGTCDAAAVSCQVDSDCCPGLQCLSDGTCGACGAAGGSCGVSSDCCYGTGLECLGNDTCGTCAKVGGACTVTSDCCNSTDDVCYEGQCTPLLWCSACVNDNDCGTGGDCYVPMFATSGWCTTGCNSDSDCVQGANCNMTYDSQGNVTASFCEANDGCSCTAFAEPCQATSDCCAGLICDMSAGACEMM